MTGAAATIRKVVEKRLPWLLFALAAGYVVRFWSNPHGFPLVRGDSRSYLRFDPDRTAGYPVFVDAIVAVFGAPEAVPKAQIVLSAAALAFLGWCLHRAFGASAVAPLPLCVPLVRSEFAQFQAAIHTESLFVSLLCVMLGGIVLLAARPTWPRAAVSALACGLAVTVRPAGASLLPIWPIVLWFVWARCRGRRARLAAAVAVPVVACLAVESLIWRAEHGAGLRPNRADLHLYGKAFLIGSAPAAPAGAAPGFVAEARELAAPMRGLIAAAPDFRTRVFLRVIAEFKTYRAADLRIFYRTADGEKRFHADAYRTVREIGRAAVAADPVAWAGSALAHYRGYWTAYTCYEPDFLRRFHAHIEPSKDHPYFSTPEAMPTAYARHDRRLILAGTGLASLLAPVLVLGQLLLRRRAGAPPPDGRLVVAGLCGLLVHGHFLATGLFGHVDMRFAFTVWPAMFLCCVLLFDWALRSGLRVRTPRAVLRPGAFFAARPVSFSPPGGGPRRVDDAVGRRGVTAGPRRSGTADRRAGGG